jgi:hypothetical protein
MARLLLLLGAVILAFAPNTAAVAVAPFALNDQVSDQVGVLDAHTAEIRAAIDQLEADHGVRLWVVVVDSFDGIDPRAWADGAFAATGLGTNDYLLAVATGERRYGYIVASDFVLDDAALARVAAVFEDHLAENPGVVVTDPARAIGDEVSGAMGWLWNAIWLVPLSVMGIIALAVHNQRRLARAEPDAFWGEARSDTRGPARTMTPSTAREATPAGEVATTDGAGRSWAHRAC